MNHSKNILALAIFSICVLSHAPLYAQQMTAPDITAVDSLDDQAKDAAPTPAKDIEKPVVKPPITPRPSQRKPGEPVMDPSSMPALPGSDYNKKLPLVITADKTLEWHRNEKIFIARGNAVATQGYNSVSAPVLTAHYIQEDSKGNSKADSQSGGGMKITEVIASDGPVVLTSQTSKAYGDHADYDLIKGYAVMTGDHLKMVSPDQTVTARDKFEYYVDAGRLTAIGQAKVVRQQDTLEGDKIAAILKKDDQGKQVLDTLTADGHVIVTTPTETATGETGIYHSSTNKAQLKGNVKIHRGPNLLEGDRAEVDMTTNVSQIFNDQASGGRVKGVFYPNSQDITTAPPGAGLATHEGVGLERDPSVKVKKPKNLE